MFHWTYYLWLFAITYIATIIVIGVIENREYIVKNHFYFHTKCLLQQLAN